MTVSATLDKTVRLYRANFKPLITVAAVASLFQLPVVLVMARMSRPDGGGLFQAASGSLSLLFFALLCSVAGVPLYYGATSAAAISAVGGQPISVGAALRRGASRYFTLLGVTFIIGLAAGVGTLLLIFPGIYIYLGFSLAYLAILDEDLDATAGLRRSWSLADGKRWLLFGLLFAWMILQAVLSYGVSALLHMFGMETAAGPLAQTLSQMLVLPCHSLSLMLVVHEVRITREGRDLVLEAQRLAETAPPAAPRPPTADPPTTL